MCVDFEGEEPISKPFVIDENLFGSPSLTKEKSTKSVSIKKQKEELKLQSSLKKRAAKEVNMFRRSRTSPIKMMKKDDSDDDIMMMVKPELEAQTPLIKLE